jgi:hypothetical protein
MEDDQEENRSKRDARRGHGRAVHKSRRRVQRSAAARQLPRQVARGRGAATAGLIVVIMAGVVVGAARPRFAKADASGGVIDVTVNAPTGPPQNVEVTQADLTAIGNDVTNYTYIAAAGSPLANYGNAMGNTRFSGVSLARLAQFVGVSSAGLLTQSSAGAGVTVAVSGGGSPTNVATITGSEAANGFPDDPNAGDSKPAIAFVPQGTADVIVPTIGVGSGGTAIRAAISSADGVPHLSLTFNLVSGLLGVSIPQPTPAVPTVNSPVQFGAPAVTLPGGAVDRNTLAYEWDFGAPGSVGDTDARAAPTHTYTTAGTYEATVTVTDTNGRSGVGEVPVVVSPGKAAKPGQSKTGGATGGGGGTQVTGGGGGGKQALSTGPVAGSSKAPAVTVAPPSRTATARAPAASARPPGSSSQPSSSSTSSSSLSKGDGGARTGSGSGGGRTGRGAAATGVGGSGRNAGSGGAGASSRRGDPGTVHPLTASSASGLTGVLIDSVGSPIEPDALTVLQTRQPLVTLLQSLARASAGKHGHGGLAAWMIGALALAAFLASGVLRESEPRRLRRLRSRSA